MNKKYAGLILLGLLVFFAGISCKSTPAEEEVPPAAEETAPPPETADQASLAALDAAAARAEASRKAAEDFSASSLFPSEWQSADSLYGQAGEQRKSATSQEARDSAARYNAAADAFDALFQKAAAANYERMDRELTAARDAAVNAGAEDLVPDYLLSADNAAAAALEKYEAKDYYGSRDAAAEAQSMYAALESGLKAYNVRDQIAAREFEVYDPVNIEQADDTMYAAADDYENKRFADAKAKADESFLKYDKAMKTAWESFAAEKGAVTYELRQTALNLKANVAVRPQFNEAQGVFDRANNAFRLADYEQAAVLFEECEPKFDAVVRTAREKRLAAERALEEANRKMAVSDETARNAEIILEGGAR